jgi:hypothetical protein
MYKWMCKSNLLLGGVSINKATEKWRKFVMLNKHIFLSLILCLTVILICPTLAFSQELPVIKDLSLLSLKVVNVRVVDKLTIEIPSPPETIQGKIVLVEIEGSLPNPASVPISRKVAKADPLETKIGLWAGYEGKGVKSVSKASRVGTYYVLNRVEGQTIFHSSVATKVESTSWHGMVGTNIKHIYEKGKVNINVAYVLPKGINSFFIYYSAHSKGKKVDGEVVVP